MSQPHMLSLVTDLDQIWPRLRFEAGETQTREPALASFIHAVITGRADFTDALGHLLAEELASRNMDALQLLEVMSDIYKKAPAIITAAQKDLMGIMERDPAALNLITPFLFFKGFHALQSYRVAHWLWLHDRKVMALYLQSRIARRFAVDIHPGAAIGQGVMLDHANGIVIGETSVVEDNVSFLHSVTLGGTGKECGDRHPKIRSGAMIGAGAKILGNIEIGANVRVAAGSVVLQDVPANKVVAGVPARIVGDVTGDKPFAAMDQTLPPIV